MGCCFSQEKNNSSATRPTPKVHTKPIAPGFNSQRNPVVPQQITIKSSREQNNTFEESKGNQYDNINPEERKKLSIACKEKGNELFKNKKFILAIDEYTKAIKLYPNEAAYFSNRALCYKSLNNWDQVSIDSDMTIRLDENNYKGYHLKACALIELGKGDPGVGRLEEGINLLIRSLAIEIQSMRARDKATQDELVGKLNKAKKILWLKKKENKMKKITQTTTLVEKLIDKSNINSAQKADFKMLFESWAKETTYVNDSDVPEYLQCKITFDIIKKPFITSAGVTYEEDTLAQHFKKNGYFDPCTRQPNGGPLIRNKNLERAIVDFEEKNPWSVDTDGINDYKTITL